MKKLKNPEYITVSEDGYLSLTKSGIALARQVYERRTLLTDWLVYLGVSPEIIFADACKMEHDISEDSYQAMKKCILSLLGKKSEA